mmetsp:Transcript_14792/g.22835  ORF Transcript_14792/g.22835 Transcript_14792/m.22835 type:complete len:258 (+) Transcript_14792:64-837(+)
MVRLSGALDAGAEVERERRKLPPTNQGRGINRADASRKSGTGTRIHNNNNIFNLLPSSNNRSDEALSERIPQSNFVRGVQHHPTVEHDKGGGRNKRRLPVKITTQVQNQERLRPKLLSSIPRIIKQESIEMEPLLSGSVSPPPSTLPTSSRKDNNRIHANTSSAQVMHHRNHRESKLAPPRQYTNVLMDTDEEDDIVCCEDSFRHEGTKNICTIFIWAALVFFIMNRFFLHMSMYLQRGEETKEVFVVRDNNFTSMG